MKAIKRLALISLATALCSCGYLRPEPSGQAGASAVPSKKLPAKTAKQKPIPAKARARQASWGPKKQPSPQLEAVRQDIWGLIGQNLDFSLDVADEQVRAQLKRYAKNQPYFARTLKRAELYLPYVMEQVLQNDMPAEIALLPFIESAFNPFAYSHSGAAGLWQIIPSTGDHLNLKRNEWYDGRRDVIRSTAAAINYLSSLNQMFDGDWLLTLAAYNAGPGTVQRALKRNAAKGREKDFWSLKLRRETTRYVPRLIALSKVVAEPEKYGVTLTAIPREPQLTIVKLEKPIDLNQAAVLADITTDDVYKLNPGYKRWVTPLQGPYHLVLPKGASAGFQDKLAALPEDKWQPLQTYTVVRGDTLGKIARRHKLSSTELAQLNNIGKTGVLRVGQVLRVPKVGAPAMAAGAVLASYKVKQGDSLWSIARANKVTVKNLMVWNQLTRQATLQPGQIIRFYPKGKQQRHHYRVRSGDSLYSIAKRHKVSLKDLLAWNNLSSNSLIKPGQVLAIY